MKWMHGEPGTTMNKKTTKIDDDLSVFIAYYQGAQLKYKVKKIINSLKYKSRIISLTL